MFGYPHDRKDFYHKPPRPFSTRLPEPNWELGQQMRFYLNERGISYGIATRQLWYPSDSAGDALPRVVIPAASRNENNRYWQARAMVPAEKRYTSPYASRGDAIILFYDIVTRLSPWVVVEGPMDALSLMQHGIKSIGLMGLTPSAEVIEHIVWRFNTSNTSNRTPHAVFLADSDHAELMAAVMRRVIDKGSLLRCRLMLSYPYKDFNAIPTGEVRGFIKDIQAP